MNVTGIERNETILFGSRFFLDLEAKPQKHNPQLCVSAVNIYKNTRRTDSIATYCTTARLLCPSVMLESSYCTSCLPHAHQ